MPFTISGSTNGRRWGTPATTKMADCAGNDAGPIPTDHHGRTFTPEAQEHIESQGWHVDADTGHVHDKFHNPIRPEDGSIIPTTPAHAGAEQLPDTPTPTTKAHRHASTGQYAAGASVMGDHTVTHVDLSTSDNAASVFRRPYVTDGHASPSPSAGLPRSPRPIGTLQRDLGVGLGNHFNHHGS